MAYAVSLFFDAETDRTVRDLWDAIDAAGISSVLAKGPYNPHLTLAIFDDVDVERSVEALATLAASELEIPITLPSVGIFTGSESVVFLAATMTERLLALHRQVHALMADLSQAPVPYYLPDRWNPHCTVAYPLAIGEVYAAIAVCEKSVHEPIIGSAMQIGLIETPAEVEICRFDLQSADGR